MSDILNSGEREFMEIFKRNKKIVNDSIMIHSSLITGQIHKYMSEDHYKDLENIINSLVEKNIISWKNDEYLVLTQKGEDYFWNK